MVVRKDPIDPSAWGIQTTYRNYRDEPRVAPFATVAKILEVMNARPEGPPEGATTVIHAGDRPHIPNATMLTLEDGSAASVESDWPDEIPLGYHDITHRDGRTTRLIVTPPACHLPEPPPRSSRRSRRTQLGAWGWSVQLYSLRSRNSWGIGDLADLRKLGEWSARQGAGMLLLNPLHAPEPGTPQQSSPYYPSSRRFRNPLYLRIEEVPGAAAVDIEPLARAGRALNDEDFVDRDAVFEAKMGALDRIWESWSGAPELDAFIAREGSALESFATYMSLHEAHGGGPSVWPPEYSHPDSPAVDQWRREHDDHIRFHQWVQWLLDEQLKEAAGTIGLVHDLAIGVDPHGADAWLWQDVLARDVAVGAPPDEFNTRGQNWGLPPFDPWKLRAARYEPFISTIRAALSRGSGVRIDHVMGLFRLYWLPEGVTPGNGTYVHYPHDDLLGILALESHRSGAFVIGEDLGTVETMMRDEMAARRMLSTKVFWFEEGPADGYPESALATVTTHDLPTVAGVWTGADLAEQQELELQPDPVAAEALRLKLEKLPGVKADDTPSTAVRAVYQELARAPSALIVATLEDALGVEHRPNLPGTGDERPNWRMRLPLTLEQLQEDSDVATIARVLSRRSGRIQMQRATPTLAHHYAAVGDIHLHYVTAGEGPLVLLLHGFPDFWYSWRNQIPTLAEAGFRVVAPDMRGFNESDKPEGVGAYALDRLVEDVEGMIDHLGEERAYVVGHDWGGVIAWHFAMRRPERLRRLAVLNSPHPRSLARAITSRQVLKSWYVLLFQLPWLPEQMLSMGNFALLRKALSAGSKRGLDEDEMEEYIAAARRSGNLGYGINYYRSLLRGDPIEMLRDFRPMKSPVLVLWGDEDFVLESGTADPGAAWADVTIRHFPGAGHFVHWDEPARVNDELIHFLGRPDETETET